MQNHAAQFVGSLDPNHRNALRAVLLRETGLADLRTALGIQRALVIPGERERTGLAASGRTIELFRPTASPADIKEVL